MGISPTGGLDVGGEIEGCGDLRLPPPEHSRTFYCYQSHCGSVSSSVEEAKVKCVQAVVGARRTGFGGDADGSLGGETDGRGEDKYRMEAETDKVGGRIM